jgi:hypothetical protein
VARPRHLSRCAVSALAGALAALPQLARAGEADVVAARAECAERMCRFFVTVRHADEGWKHYADRYEVLAPDGSVLATRVLQHPHVEEQPVTRALGGVRIPAGITRVRVRAHDLVHGYGGAETSVEIPG